MNKSIVFYTDGKLEGTPIGEAVKHQLKLVAGQYEIVAVSVVPIKFMPTTIILDEKPGIVTMFRQILAGLRAATGEIVYMAEHDVLYHRMHFDPEPFKDTYCYNQNNWKVRSTDGQALFYTCKQTLGLCAYRELLIQHYEKRLARIEQDGKHTYATGFEPGCHKPPRGIDSYPALGYMAEFPNLDIRHGKNLTPSRWRQDQFRNPGSCKNWQMSDVIPYWGITKDRFDNLLKDVMEDRYAD